MVLWVSSWERRRCRRLFPRASARRYDGVSLRLGLKYGGIQVWICCPADLWTCRRSPPVRLRCLSFRRPAMGEFRAGDGCGRLCRVTDRERFLDAYLESVETRGMQQVGHRGHDGSDDGDGCGHAGQRWSTEEDQPGYDTVLTVQVPDDIYDEDIRIHAPSSAEGRDRCRAGCSK